MGNEGYANTHFKISTVFFIVIFSEFVCLTLNGCLLITQFEPRNKYTVKL